MHIVIGLLLVLLGGMVMVFSRQLVEFFGRVQWAEVNLGSTRGLYVLLGMFVIVVGILMMFGLFKGSGI